MDMLPQLDKETEAIVILVIENIKVFFFAQQCFTFGQLCGFMAIKLLSAHISSKSMTRCHNCNFFLSADKLLIAL